MTPNEMLRRGAKNTLMYAFLVFLVLLSVIPFYMVLTNSTHSSFDIVTRLNLLPGDQFFVNYRTMMEKANIWQGFFNSLLVTVPFTAFTGYFGAMTAYGFAKYRFRFHDGLFMAVLVSMMLPAQLSIIGFYKLNLSLHLLNSYVPFIVPGIANATAVFFLKGIIEQSIPDSMLEAGRIEGCSEMRIFHRLILPCITPGIATMCIFHFVSSWNNYLGPLIILSENKKYTMPVLIAMIKGLYKTNYGAMYVAIVLSVAPIIALYIFCSRFIINGLTVGSDK
jgi:multiple sugar transport system permease protein